MAHFWRVKTITVMETIPEKTKNGTSISHKIGISEILKMLLSSTLMETHIVPYFRLSTQLHHRPQERKPVHY